MKFFFLADDTLYKIYKTLEKAPINKSIVIYIEDDSDFFVYQWRAKQIKELIEQRWLNISFVAKNAKQEQYYNHIQLPYIAQHTKSRIKYLYMIYNFLFNIKQFHRTHQKALKYSHYIILMIEWLLLFFVGYIIWSLVVPSVTITIDPSTESEDIVYNIRFSHNWAQWALSDSALTVPIMSWFILYKHTLALSIGNAQYLRKPAQWIVKFTNTSPTTYSLVKWTQLISNNGLLFRTNHWVSVPWAQQGQLWSAFAEVVASEADAQWDSMWPRGNIQTGEVLLVRNLRNSLMLRQLVAKPTKPFVWWSQVITGVVSNQDVATISGALYRTIQEQQGWLIRGHVSVLDGVLLPIYDLPMRVRSIDINAPVGSSQAIVSWSMVVEIPYYYARMSDIDSIIRQYLREKPSSHTTIMNIQYNTLTFYPSLSNSWSSELILPTKVSIIWWYDIKKDTNRILQDIRQRIVWLDVQKAKAIVLWYPEISTVSFSLSPWWYSAIPTAQSRILFDIK